MKIREYLDVSHSLVMGDISKLLEEIPKEDITKEDLLESFIELLNKHYEAYDKGFNHAIELIDKCDRKLLDRKVPPHILK